MSKTAIDCEIERLELEKEKIMKLLALRSDVSSLKLTALSGTPAFKASLQTICKAVADHFGISVKDLVTKGRERWRTDARMTCFYLLRVYSDATYEEIGRPFNLDHGTVIHGENRVKEMLSVDMRFARRMDTIREKIGAVKV